MLFSSLSPCRHSHIMRLLAPLGAALALAAFAVPAHAQSACDADTNDDGTVDSADLGTLLSAWGPCAGCSADLNRDGEVDSADLGALLSLWGESCVQGPVVKSISPAGGPRWGSTEVVITGSNLGSVHEVVIGDRAAAILSVSETTLTVITAAGDVGPADVVVEAPSSADTLEGAFTYTATQPPSWATVVEETPDPKVVTDPAVRAAIEASGLPWRVFANGTGFNGEPIELVLVPAGSFQMGCIEPADDTVCPTDATPVHTVELRDFYIGRTEVTQSQWTSWGNSNSSASQDEKGSPSFPVELVSQVMATGFTTQTGTRLPTEAEWERAYRAGLNTAFYTGTNSVSDLADCFNFKCGPRPVLEQPVNALGIYGMAGNVSEFVNDFYAADYYQNSPGFDPRGPKSGPAVVRGGNFQLGTASPTDIVRMTAYGRSSIDPFAAEPSIGFRVARDGPVQVIATGLSPSVGIVDGGQSITVTGRYLDTVTGVRFACGPQSKGEATIVSQSYSRLTFLAPPGQVGTCSLIYLDWQSADGSSSGSLPLANAFEYVSVEAPLDATVLEPLPDPAVVTDPALRAAIIATGYAWRVRDNATNIEMVLVPAGSFAMGCTASHAFGCPSSELPRHQVTLTKAFYLGRYEVTQAEWTAIMGSNPSVFQGPSYPDAANHPVDSVFRADARAFACTTGTRFPTEAEWEYAYRAGTATEYHSMPGFPAGTSDPDLIESIAWFGAGYGQNGGNSGGQTHPVGLKAANGLGLHDMSGNVEEWVFDRIGSYGAAAETDPTGPATGFFQLSRGGSWYSARDEVRGASRAFFSSDFSGYGLRVARDIVPQPFTITEVMPPQGSTLGGTQVTLTGHGFDCVQTDLVIVGVNSSGALATEVNAVNDRTMTLVMPARPAGLGTISLYNPFRQLYAYGSYTYVLPAPAITAVAPTVGPTSGGTQLVITGTNLSGATAVTVGGVAATEVIAHGATMVTAVTPPGAQGLANVTVTTGGGTAVAPSAFNYYQPGQWRTVLEASPDPAVVTNQDLRAAIAASGLPWRVRDDLTQVEMVLIPAGTFAMGGSPSAFYQPAASELPVHTVTISMPFYISRYEVTQAQWTFIMGSNPSEFRGFADSPQRPVEGLNWFEAKGFATAAQMRLPTEAEWEYAYRAGTTTAFHGTPGNSIGFTDDAVVGAIAWFSGNSGSQTRPVGQKLPNGFGLYDMSGNVNEWVNDWFGSNYYAISPAVDPQGPAVGDFGARVYRGGGIISFSRWLRSAARNFNSPLVRAGYVGVRVVRDP
jgi:formylglycine-generating enzyme required for sulfatase activity